MLGVIFRGQSLEVNREKFAKAYKCQIPEEIEKLYEIKSPARFEFNNKPIIVEIQYYLGTESILDKYSNEALYLFAINTDGSELFADLSAKNIPILQKEFHDIESIGVTLIELLNAYSKQI